MKIKAIKAEITLDDNNVSILFKSGKIVIMWEEMTRQQQKHICNTLGEFERLFSKFIKE